MSAALETTMVVPSAVSALELGPDSRLCVGSDDGCVRWYNLPSSRVVRAIKPLGDEVSSLLCPPPRKDEAGVVWVASGRRAFSFPADSSKIISTEEDAIFVINLGEDDDDDLNELSISEKFLAFSSDSGGIGVVDLATKSITRMRSRHNTVCGSVKFVPDRPYEIVSGGYDSALLHFDVGQRSILSRFDIPAPPPSEGASLAPPFVLSLSVSLNGVVAASTADGRVWLGGGGEKRPEGKKKRSRKWQGLKEDEGVWLQVAEGPVVSCVLTENGRLITCSLLGVLSEYTVSRDTADKLQAAKLWSTRTKSLEKVNAMVVHHSCVVLGGFGKDGKGVVEVWSIEERHVS